MSGQDLYLSMQNTVNLLNAALKQYGDRGRAWAETLLPDGEDDHADGGGRGAGDFAGTRAVFSFGHDHGKGKVVYFGKTGVQSGNVSACERAF